MEMMWDQRDLVKTLGSEERLGEHGVIDGIVEGIFGSIRDLMQNIAIDSYCLPSRQLC